jgi:type 2 lantibiotic biosynthesis protein LanM
MGWSVHPVDRAPTADPHAPSILQARLALMSDRSRADVTGKPPRPALASLAWRGASLGERLAVARGVRSASADDTAGDLTKWARAVAPSGDAAFERRLAWDGLDVRVARLASSDAAPVTLPPDWPPYQWTEWLSSRAAQTGRCRERMGTAAWAADVRAVCSDPPFPFVEAWMPWLEVAREELALRLDAERRPLLSADAALDLDRHLVRSLAAVGTGALFERFELVRAAAPGGAYRRFVASLLDGGWSGVVAAYPVLGRHLVQIVWEWVNLTVELLDRLRADRPSIESAFGAFAETIRTIRPALSDRHEGGRTVAMVGFDSGLRLAYKPRCVSLEAAFNRFLAWIRARGVDSVPAPLRVVDRGTHGWVEWVDQAEFSSRDAVQDYFRRAGGLACVVHLLGGSDLHGENLVASVDGPTLVDTEMLLQPATGGSATGGAEADDDARRSVAGSCLAPGLVSLIQVDDDGRAYDVGGLQPSPRRAAPVGRRVWLDPQDDAVRASIDPTVAPALANDVRLDGVVQPPSTFAREICEGFARVSGFLAARRDALLAPDGPLQTFADCPVRILFRPSGQYGALQYLLATPRYQRSGLDRSLAFETLLRVFAHEPTRPRLWPLVAEEREALERLDIPRFTVPATAVAIPAADGGTVAGFLAKSGLAAARERVSAIDDEELAHHLEDIRAALQPVVIALPSPGDRPDTAAARLVVAAEAVGELVLRRAERSGHRISWSSGGRAPDLSGGIGGISVFLAGLAAVTGRERWRDAALAAVSALTSGGALERVARGAAVGACRGLPSVAYALAAAGTMLDDDATVGIAAESLAGISTAAIDADAVLDVEGGCAGALMILLAVHARRPDGRLIALASRCASRLVAAQLRSGPARGAWPAGADALPRPGFAHGAAGIACALERWLAERHAVEVETAIHAAWEYERRVFEEAGGCWPVTRSDGSRIVMAGWCHGAPGIALARATGGRRVADSFVDTEIRTTLALTAGAPHGKSDHLCCGTLGRADVLLSVGLITGREDAADRGRLLAEGVAGQILDQGRLGARGLGFERGAPLVGMLHGLAGIGYQLLRTSLPEVLPSVLSFEALPGRAA